MLLLGLSGCGPTEQPSQAEAEESESPPATDIYLWRNDDTYGLPYLRNVTDRDGYDNQPSFAPDSMSFLYTSRRGEQTDVYRYDLESGEAFPVVESSDSEYSPRFAADDPTAIHAVRVTSDDAQRFVRIDSDGSSRVLSGDLVNVGYYAWLADSRVALFLVDEPMRLVRFDPDTAESIEIDRSIGRCFVAVDGGLLYVRSPEDGQREFAFHGKPGSGHWLAGTELPGESEDFAIAPDGSVIIGDGSRLLRRAPDQPEWTEIADLADVGVHAISRLALSPDGLKMALVVERGALEAVSR